MSVVDLDENIVCYVTAHVAISLRFDDSDSEASEIDSDNEFDDSPDEEWIPDAENVYRRPLIDSGKSVFVHSHNEISHGRPTASVAWNYRSKGVNLKQLLAGSAR